LKEPEVSRRNLSGIFLLCRHSSVNPQQIASGPASTPASTPKLATNKGPWQVLWSGMAPQMVAAQNDAIEMGKQLAMYLLQLIYARKHMCAAE
jgi:hypothetical protein